MGKKGRLPLRLPKYIGKLFPKLIDYVITSPRDASYNCIAFAAGDTARKWDAGMVPTPGYYWPPEVLEDDNDDIEALKRVFGQLGYVECDNGELEPGYLKVALFAVKTEDWLHAAIQDAGGEWNSKLGSSYDVRHKSPQCIEGPWWNLSGS